MRLFLSAILGLAALAAAQSNPFSPGGGYRGPSPITPDPVGGGQTSQEVMRTETFDIAKVGQPGRIETTPLFRKIWEAFRTNHRVNDDGLFEKGIGFPETPDNQAFFLHYLANNTVTLKLEVNEICPRCQDKGYKSGRVRAGYGRMDEIGEVTCDLCEGRGGPKGLVEYRLTYSGPLPALPETPAQARYRTNLEKAQGGNLQAQLAVSEALWEGKGTGKDREAALRWLGKAAGAGSQPAAKRLIELHSAKGASDYADPGFAAALQLLWLPSLGIDWDSTGHNQPAMGEVEARVLLGQLRDMLAEDPKADFPLAGEVRRQLRAKSRDWQLRASSGDAQAKHLLGACQLMAVGVDRDTRAALDWLEKSALKGHPGSLHLLGCLHEQGLVYDKNTSAAYVMYNLAAQVSGSDFGSSAHASRTAEWAARADADKLLAELLPSARSGQMNAGQLAKVAKLPKGRPAPIALAQRPGTAAPVARGPSRGHSYGSGIVLTKEGHIATNHHVVEDGGSIWIVRYVNGELQDRKRAHVVAFDSTLDLALLQCSDWTPAEGAPGTPPAVAWEQDVKLGAPIFVLGYPLPHVTSSNVKYTKGDISDLAGLHNNPTRIQHTAPIQPGNSGGPMCLEDGRIAGIVVSSLGEGFALRTSGSLPQGVNFSVNAKSLLEMAKQAGVFLPTSDKGYENPIEHVKAYTVQIQVEK